MIEKISLIIMIPIWVTIIVVYGLVTYARWNIRKDGGNTE